MRSLNHVEQKAFGGGVSQRGFPGSIDCILTSTPCPATPRRGLLRGRGASEQAPRGLRLQPEDQRGRADLASPSTDLPGEGAACAGRALLQ